MADNEQSYLVEITADLAAVFVSNNSVASRDLPELISAIHAAFTSLGAPAVVEPAATKPTGAVTVRKSIASREHILSMIDGKPYKTLTRHISKNGYTADSYRETFGLPASYPMTAPDYSERRSVLARTLGLGRKAGVKVPRPAGKPGRKPKAAPPA